MGSRITLADGLKFRAQVPHAGHWTLVRNSQPILEVDGDTLEHPVKEPGVYRAEVSLQVAGEAKPWILSNPIYVQDAVQ
jgi:hypothetical protein